MEYRRREYDPIVTSSDRPACETRKKEGDEKSSIRFFPSVPCHAWPTAEYSIPASSEREAQRHEGTACLQVATLHTINYSYYRTLQDYTKSARLTFFPSFDPSAASVYLSVCCASALSSQFFPSQPRGHEPIVPVPPPDRLEMQRCIIILYNSNHCNYCNTCIPQLVRNPEEIDKLASRQATNPPGMPSTASTGESTGKKVR